MHTASNGILTRRNAISLLAHEELTALSLLFDFHELVSPGETSYRVNTGTTFPNKKWGGGCLQTINCLIKARKITG